LHFPEHITVTESRTYLADSFTSNISFWKEKLEIPKG